MNRFGKRINMAEMKGYKGIKVGDDLVRVTVCIRASTLKKIDDLAASQRRSRSQMMDVMGAEYKKKK